MACIRKAQLEDLAAAVRLAGELWPEHSVEELEAELEPYLEKEDGAIFLAYDRNHSELANEDSRRFHRALGFEEANRIICFVRRLV